MATIVPNELAPADFHFLSLANAELDFSSGSVEEDDAVVLANAQAHPWVDVQYPEADDESAADAASADQQVHPVAIDAGLNQNEAVSIEADDLTDSTVEDVEIAVTLAAAPEPSDDEEDQIATDATPAQQEFGAFGADTDNEVTN